MEFTKTEIEMFGKAKELQADWKPQRGDWFYKTDGGGYGAWLICAITGGILWCAGDRMSIPEFNNRMSIPEFNNRLVEFRVPEHYTWIPSLERLMAMASEIQYATSHYTSPASNWDLSFNDFTLVDDNLKLLLLSLVMRQRYQRRWDGKTWRKLAKPKAK